MSYFLFCFSSLLPWKEKFSLEEDGVITECLVKVLEDDETIDFDFQTENVVSKVVFKVSSWEEKQIFI